VNGDGKIYRTRDSGTSWQEVANKPGTYFRTIAFVDEKSVFAGNVGTHYFPGVKDETPLYETKDGGDTWNATDGGLTWREVKLVDLHAVWQFGVAFADEYSGWVGTTNGGYQTEDGGTTWTHVDGLGRCVNKIRIVKRASVDGAPNLFDPYAIGADVRKWRNN
jgi:photosystem II stability/assembly factor-like uncharacterized protein